MQVKTTVALLYDFDRTLTTKDMQEFSFIPAIGMSAEDFWTESDALAKEHKMDYILATMHLMVQKAAACGVDMSREALKKHGENIAFCKGVEGWFSRINAFGESLGLDVKHYIISCGLKPMIEGCKVAGEFANVFACDYMYDEAGKPVWPSQAINYSNKIQYIYRINKGVEDVSEHDKLNMRTPHEQRAIPFANMIYIGDGLTDVPSMTIVRLKGGFSIGVHQDGAPSRYLLEDKRVDFFVNADYSEGSEMDAVVKAILEKMHAAINIRRLARQEED